MRRRSHRPHSRNVPIWAHARRGFFELAELQKGPIAIAAVKRIDALFAIEREINGCSAEQRRAVRNERSSPLIEDLEAWLRAQRARLSAKSKTANAIDYLLKRWPAFTRFLDDGRICLLNNAAERGAARYRRRQTQLDVRRLRRGRPSRRGAVHPDRNGEAQRHRSTRLARRPPRPPAGPSREPYPRTAALAVAETRADQRRRVGAHANAAPSTHLSRGPRRMGTPQQGFLGFFENLAQLPLAVCRPSFRRRLERGLALATFILVLHCRCPLFDPGIVTEQFALAARRWGHNAARGWPTS